MYLKPLKFINYNQSPKTLRVSVFNIMDNELFLESDSGEIVDKPPNKCQSQASTNLETLNKLGKSQILPVQRSTIAGSFMSKEKSLISNRSSRKMSSITAGKKARQKKKQYLESLQTKVKDLEAELVQYDEEIKKTNQAVGQAINSTKNNENSITFSELLICTKSEDPNQDKINLLLDMIKFRIGASGKQRSAKIEYYFKQLVNTLFPALHRYMMYTSEKKIDFFKQDETIDIQSFISSPLCHSIEDQIQQQQTWTGQFIDTLHIQKEQKVLLQQLRKCFVQEKAKTKSIIKKLNEIKLNIKEEEQSFETVIDQMRKILNPKQNAHLVLFAEKYKYKREISMQTQIQSMNIDIVQKKIKKDSYHSLAGNGISEMNNG